MKTAGLIPKADLEFVDALFHHEQKWKKKGRNLYSEFEMAFREIGLRPERFPHVDRRHRKAPLENCPYSLIYRVFPDVVWIIAIPHHKRKDGYWRNRKIPKEF